MCEPIILEPYSVENLDISSYTFVPRCMMVMMTLEYQDNFPSVVINPIFLLWLGLEVLLLPLSEESDLFLW